MKLNRPIGVRFNHTDEIELRKEAEKNGLATASYIRNIVKNRKTNE